MKQNNFFIKYWDLILLSVFVLIYSVTFSTLSILRHNAFASNYDLANMSQTVWNTLHGRPFQLSGVEGTISRFSIHADLILILLSPLYLIWERVYMLLMAQSLSLGLGAVPVYFLAKKVLGNKLISLSLVLVYLLNPAMEWTNIYDFHGVALAIPFLLSTFYFAYVKRWRWFWLFIALSLITKEEISLFIAMLGVFIFFAFKEKAIGIITFILGILWFSLFVFVVIPKFTSTGQYWALNWFPYFNPTNDYPLAKVVIQQFFLAQDTLNYYLILLKPFGFLPILGLPWLLLSLPELTINVLSAQAQMRSIFFHYDSGITPALVIATIFGLKYLKAFLKSTKPLTKYSKWIIYLTSLVLLGISLRVNYHYSPLPTTPSCWCLSYQVTADDRDFAKVLAKIPRTASVTSSGEIRSHIARRENSFTLPNGVYTADYVAILDETRIVGDYSPKEFENALLKDPKFLKSHELVSHIGHFYLFKKTGQDVTQKSEGNPLSIESMRVREYPGSDLVIEQTLQDGSNYHQYIASYKSDGLKIYGLLTVPIGEKPTRGWPVIIFNHGYIPPNQYQTTERYVSYVDGFTRAGYIVFKSDYRGNGLSEGQPEGAYYSPAYTTDVLNALSSLKKYKDADPKRIGMWGHSLGGNITLRSLVVDPEIKAAVIWGGVVGTYDGLMNNWRRRVLFTPSSQEIASRNRTRASLLQKYGSPSANPKFWNSIDPNYYLDLVAAPIQLHAGLDDEEVPWQFSQGLKDRLEKVSKIVEFYTYEGADHNISGPAFNLAMQRSIDFFNKYLAPVN